MAVNKKLRQEATDLGISVDSRWSDTTIQQRIDEKKADNEAAGEGGFYTQAESASKEALSGKPMTDEGKALQMDATPKAIKAQTFNKDPSTALIQTAQGLHIEVDGDWDDARLRGEIQQALEGRADLQVKGAVPSSEMSDEKYDPATQRLKQGLDVIFNRDYWDEDGNRVVAGTRMTIQVENEAARNKYNELYKKDVIKLTELPF